MIVVEPKESPLTWTHRVPSSKAIIWRDARSVVGRGSLSLLDALSADSSSFVLKGTAASHDAYSFGVEVVVLVSFMVESDSLDVWMLLNSVVDGI